MARDRSRGRKNHPHREGIRCSICKPLSKEEVARIAPPPPPKPVAQPTVADLQRNAYLTRANALAVRGRRGGKTAESRVRRSGSK